MFEGSVTFGQSRDLGKTNRIGILSVSKESETSELLDIGESHEVLVFAKTQAKIFVINTVKCV